MYEPSPDVTIALEGAKSIRLTDVVGFRRELSPSAILRRDRRRVAGLRIQLLESSAVLRSSVRSAVERALSLPPGVEASWAADLSDL